MTEYCTYWGILHMWISSYPDQFKCAMAIRKKLFLRMQLCRCEWICKAWWMVEGVGLFGSLIILAALFRQCFLCVYCVVHDVLYWIDMDWNMKWVWLKLEVSFVLICVLYCSVVIFKLKSKIIQHGQWIRVLDHAREVSTRDVRGLFFFF